MKKFTSVLSVVVLSAVIGSLAGCSSAQIDEQSTSTELPVESNAGGEAFNAVASADLTPTADPSSTIQSNSESPSSNLMASNNVTAPSYSSPSPVNLGASSAGRAH